MKASSDPVTRIEQLRVLHDVARQLEVLLRANGEARNADLYQALAGEAMNLLDEGFTQRDLNELSSHMPAPMSWLDPRYADFDGKRLPWQDEVARLYPKCRELGIDLRTVGRV
jgi:hypothetical protein